MGRNLSSKNPRGLPKGCLPCAPVNPSGNSGVSGQSRVFPSLSHELLECQVWSINQCTCGPPHYFCPKGFRIPDLGPPLLSSLPF